MAFFDMNDLLIYDQESYRKGLLQRVDFMTMIAGVEARVPFLDEDLFHYVQTTQSKNKVSLFASKGVLYDVAQKILPKDIIARPKIGFASPLVDWFSEAEGMGHLLNNLLNKSEPIYKYLPFENVSSYLNQPIKKQEVEGLTFPIVSLNEWLKGIEN